jgi:hypothetical protein
MAAIKPRAMVGAGANVAMPKVNVSRQVNQGKRAPSTPKLKTKLPVLQKNPKPKVPDLFKPLGGGTGEANPQVTPRNSPKGAKQRVQTKNPFGAL